MGVRRSTLHDEYKSSRRLCIFLVGVWCLNLWVGKGGIRSWPYVVERQEHHSDRWFVEVLEADALNVASIGRAVATGAEVW